MMGRDYEKARYLNQKDNKGLLWNDGIDFEGHRTGSAWSESTNIIGKNHLADW